MTFKLHWCFDAQGTRANHNVPLMFEFNTWPQRKNGFPSPVSFRIERQLQLKSQISMKVKHTQKRATDLRFDSSLYGDQFSYPTSFALVHNNRLQLAHLWWKLLSASHYYQGGYKFLVKRIYFDID